MNRLKEEFEKNLNFDGAEYGSNWEKEDVWNWINQNYISKQQILNLECLKEEDIIYFEDGYQRHNLDNLAKNQLRKEIKEAINNLGR